MERRFFVEVKFTKLLIFKGYSSTKAPVSGELILRVTRYFLPCFLRIAKSRPRATVINMYGLASMAKLTSSTLKSMGRHNSTESIFTVPQDLRTYEFKAEPHSDRFGKGTNQYMRSLTKPPSS